MTAMIIHFERDARTMQLPWPVGVGSDDIVRTGLHLDDGARLLGFGKLGAQHVDIYPDAAREDTSRAVGLVPTFVSVGGSMFEWGCLITEVEIREDPEDRRNEIIAGLKRWAIGSYPEQVAVEFLAGTDEPLTRIWVEKANDYGNEDRYWLNWEMFDEYGGVLSSGEYATWAIARSLLEGELYTYLWSLDNKRSASLVAALARRTEAWR